MTVKILSSIFCLAFCYYCVSGGFTLISSCQWQGSEVRHLRKQVHMKGLIFLWLMHTISVYTVWYIHTQYAFYFTCIQTVSGKVTACSIQERSEDCTDHINLSPFLALTECTSQKHTFLSVCRTTIFEKMETLQDSCYLIALFGAKQVFWGISSVFLPLWADFLSFQTFQAMELESEISGFRACNFKTLAAVACLSMRTYLSIRRTPALLTNSSSNAELHSLMALVERLILFFVV